MPWDVIRRNVPRGGLVACQVPADYLIVAGISNWGAYGLAAGVRLLRHAPADPDLFNPEREYELIQTMVEEGPLVDGVSGQPEPTVDGLVFAEHQSPASEVGRTFVSGPDKNVRPTRAGAGVSPVVARSPDRATTRKSTSAPSLRPIQLRCISLIGSDQSTRARSSNNRSA